MAATGGPSPLNPPAEQEAQQPRAMCRTVYSIYRGAYRRPFHTNNQIHSIHTRFTTNLHPPTAHLTKFQKGVYYLAIKFFNNLPHNIKDLANEVIPFRNTLRRFLLIHSFYNSDEYFNYKRHSIER